MSFVSAMQSLFGGPVNTNIPAQGQPNNPANNPMSTQNPGNPMPGTVANNVTAPNGVVPVQTLPDPNAAPASPLDPFKELWDTPVVKPGDEPQSMFGKMDPKSVLDSARKVDFMKTLPPEILTAIAKGGPEGMVALSQAMNFAGQNVYANSAMATAKIVEKALTEQQDKFLQQLPSLVRKHSANESLRTENPVLNNPAIQPLVGALTEQLTRKSPNATSAEIQAQVNSYFSVLGEVFAPKLKDTPESKSANAATDWSRFLDA